jgi:hypothetical protein
MQSKETGGDKQVSRDRHCQRAARARLGFRPGYGLDAGRALPDGADRSGVGDHPSAAGRAFGHARTETHAKNDSCAISEHS